MVSAEQGFQSRSPSQSGQDRSDGEGATSTAPTLTIEEINLARHEEFCREQADYDVCLGLYRDRYTATPRSESQNAPATIDDLASFTPRADRLSAEPGDWAIAGLAINPVADDSSVVASGELLGLPAEVRFTPVEFLWDYGDGAVATTSGGGATWAELAQPEFSATATSHVYTRPGTYTLALEVRFVAEYSVAGVGWTPVAGSLLVGAGSFDVTAGSAGTVLVDRDCRAGAPGPGC